MEAEGSRAHERRRIFQRWPHIGGDGDDLFPADKLDQIAERVPEIFRAVGPEPGDRSAAPQEPAIGVLLGIEPGCNLTKLLLVLV